MHRVLTVLVAAALNWIPTAFVSVAFVVAAVLTSIAPVTFN